MFRRAWFKDNSQYALISSHELPRLPIGFAPFQSHIYKNKPKNSALPWTRTLTHTWTWTQTKGMGINTGQSDSKSDICY
jgi:hypothetical protein